jgi:hypothetical protein
MEPIICSKEKVLNITIKLWNNLNLLENPSNATIKFSNGKQMKVHLEVLQQLKFFRTILYDCGKIRVFEMTNEYVNEITFDYLYAKLVKKFCLRHDIKFIDKAQDQLNYMRMLDYLTDPDERNGLLDGIFFKEIFWIGLVSIQLQNIETFFTRIQLKNGYDICLSSLKNRPDGISKEEITYLKQYFNQSDN